MSIRLIVSQGSKRTREIRLKKPETVIGRRANCGLRIPSSEVSREHCRLVFKDGFLTVEDLASVNGTYLNGQRVTARHLVRPGDTLQVGPVTFVVQYELAEADANKLFPSAEPEELEAVAMDDEDLVPVELDDETPTELAPFENLDGQAPIELEEADLGHLPQGNDLRDILTHLDE